MNILLFSLAVFPQGWASSGGGRDENKIEADPVVGGVHVLSGERGRSEREKERGERENEKIPILYKALIVPPLELLRNS